MKLGSTREIGFMGEDIKMQVETKRNESSQSA